MKIIKIGEDFYCIAPSNVNFNTYLESFEKYLYNKELLNNTEIKKIRRYCNDDYSIYKLNIDSNSYNISGYFKYDENLIKNFNLLIARLDK